MNFGLRYFVCIPLRATGTENHWVLSYFYDDARNGIFSLSFSVFIAHFLVKLNIIIITASLFKQLACSFCYTKKTERT